MFSNRQIVMIDNASQLTGRYGRQSGLQTSQTHSIKWTFDMLKALKSPRQIPKSKLSGP